MASTDKTPPVGDEREGLRRAAAIAGEFAEIRFDDHEAKLLALGFIDLQGRLSRIHAAVEHDADLIVLPVAVREFLLRESGGGG